MPLTTNKIFKNIFRFLLLPYGVLAVGYFLTLSYVDKNLAARDNHLIYSDCYKVWATRGLVLEGDLSKASSGNSIATLSLAFAKGAKGSEVDVFYDSELDKFVVSHDYPYNLKGGKLLFLSQLLSAIGSQHYIWLDLKKLGNLSQQQAIAAASRLQTIINTGIDKDKIYIEGEDPINLGKFRDAGFLTIFDTQPLKESYWISGFVLNLYKMIFYFNDFSVMAMNSGVSDNQIFSVQAEKILSNVPLFIYHVPDDESRLLALAMQQNVRVILNTDHSINRYDLNCNC